MMLRSYDVAMAYIYVTISKRFCKNAYAIRSMHSRHSTTLRYNRF